MGDYRETVPERSAATNLILHVHPRTVPEQTLKFTLSWGLGGMSVVLVCLLALTGLLLLFVYEPSIDHAYASILTLRDEVMFGRWIRNIHHWSANILVIVVFLHLLRVFFTGAFHAPRRLNWIFGVGLFFLVLFSNFTGYLLPWDQLAYWAITICTSMVAYIPGLGDGLQKMIRGGAEIGPATLSGFFALHIAMLPIALALLMPFHFWHVRKAGGLVLPAAPGETSPISAKSVPAIPNLVVREAAVGLILLAFILVFSILWDAPLGDPANPGMSPNPAKAPWYFVGIQELLIHFHPLFAVFIIPALVVAMLFLLPYLAYDNPRPGVWFGSTTGRRMGIVSAITALVLTPVLVLADEFLIDFTTWMPGVPTVLSNGLLPAALMILVLVAFYLLMKRKYGAGKNETIQALSIFLLVGFVILTVTGIWFRGEGMALSWPGVAGIPSS